MATRKLAGRNVCRVWLLDNTMKTFLVDDDATAGDVVRLVASEMGMPEDVYDCYSLHECKDGVTIGPPLAATKSVVAVMDTWGEAEGPKFVFTVKLFMETLKASPHAKVQYMFFIQAVYNVICGVYPVTVDEAVQLAALQVLQKFGTHRPDVHKVGFLTSQLIAYIPSTLLPSKPPSAWETDIFAAHAALGCSQEAATKEYCSKLASEDFYGCAFYAVSQKFSKKIAKMLLIGVSCAGIHMFDKSTMATLGKYGLSEIFRWGFKPRSNFYFEVKKPGGSGPVYEFATIQGNEISDLLTDYAMMLLREMGVKSEFDESKAATGEPTDEDVAKAATRMQAMFRGYRLRRDLEFDYAAVRIQSMYRGYKERCNFDEMIAKMEAELEAAEAAEAATSHGDAANDPAAAAAAAMVQAAWRGAQVRADLAALEQELAITRIQAQVRGKQTRRGT